MASYIRRRKFLATLGGAAVALPLATRAQQAGKVPTIGILGSGTPAVYKAGEYYFETGNLAHSAQNKTNMPLRVLVVEILPKDWAAPAMIAPKSQ